LRAAQDGSITSHAMSPQAVMQVFRSLHRKDPPPCTLLAIRGEWFELGQPPSADAMIRLAAALQWAERWLARPVAAASV
jgi:hypothetical protein